MRLARQATEAGKHDPDVLWMAAHTLLFFTGELTTAKNLVDRALALNPNSAHAWMVRGIVLNLRNQPDRAIEAVEHATRLSPLDPLGARAFTLLTATAHFRAGRYELAIEWADRALAAQPDYRPALRFKASACAHLGQMEEAHDCLKRMFHLEPGLTIAQVKASSPPFPTEMSGRYLEGLRKAGLPEE